MAKKKTTNQIDGPTDEASASNGQVKEKLTNKAEAVRRALAQLGKKAKPAQIQDFIKAHFDVEMTTPAISVYKSNLIKKSGKKGKPGRRPKAAGAAKEPAPKPALHGGVTFKDLRFIKEISNRLGPARMRELVEWIVD